MSVLKQLQDIVGAAQVLTGEAMDPYVVDWRGLTSSKSVSPIEHRSYLLEAIPAYVAGQRLMILGVRWWFAWRA
jgi:hypothetical protein